MKFGKLDTAPPGLDWRHPVAADGVQMADVARGKTNPNIKAGGTMWTIRGWRGSVYPEKDPQRTWPGHYGRQFGTLEFNAT
ncbi:MAG TPA: hypothetical protein DCX49_07100, partial [Flavobacteriales bacterium]|nr:hypothetical protein [Flavobacteriales bacterium]